MADGFYFDEAAADRACEFVERFCRHGKGAKAGEPLILADWQRELIRTIFGWKRESDGTRRYRQVYLEVARGNGKSTLASAVALYMLLADGEQGGEVVSVASNRAQAAIVFDCASDMVRAEKALRTRSQTFRRSITVPGTNSSYRVLSSDAPGAHGLNISAAIFDEVHTQPNRDLWDAVSTAMVKREQPLLFAITTAGLYEPESLCWGLHDYALKVRDGIIEDDAFLPVIYAAEEGDDITDPATWRKANPNLGISVSETYLAEEAEKALKIASYTNSFKRLHLDIWSQTVTRWIAPDVWDACRAELPDLSGRECFGGLDLSTTTDLSAFALVFPGAGDDPTYLLPLFWIPERKLQEKRDRVPYEAWKRAGLLTVTGGDVVDYDRIRADIAELGQQYAIQEIRYDPWNATQLATQLAEQDGFTLTQMRQGFVSMNAPTKELERRIIGRTIAHDGNPVLRWMVSNVAVKQDPAGNLKPDKSKSTERIDGVVAAIMALSGAMTTDGPSVYTGRGLVTL